MSDVDERGSAQPLHAPNGRFAPGNPGRRPGSKNKLSKAALETIRGMSDAAITTLRQRIEAGDMVAVVYVLDRVLPKGRTVELDGVSAEDVSSALIAGEITTAELKDIATALSKLRELEEMDALRARVAEIEERLAR